MGRRVVRQVNQPKRRTAMSGLLVLAVAILLLFAAVGLVSAGTFVAQKVSGTASPTPRASNRPGNNSLAMQQIALAHAQATAIVRNAQAKSRSIVTSARASASKQANSIVAAARRHAASIARAQPTAVPAPVSSAPTTTNGGAQSGTSSSPPAYLGGGTSGGSTSASGSSTGTSSTGSGAALTGGSSPSTPDLSGVPSSWRVVAYNATFGSGPGSAGGITVTNRGSSTFSGVAKVVYVDGGSAAAAFSGLAPGQTVTLPLNGRTYSGGGYQILVTNVH